MGFYNHSTNLTTVDNNITPDTETQLGCVEKRLWQVVAPVIIIVGLLGNLMVVVVFSRLHFSKSSTLVHFWTLAVTDSVILCVGPLRRWIIHTFNYDFRLYSSAGCKIGLFLLYTSLDFSAWILVSVTAERTLSVFKPLQVRSWITVRRTLTRLAMIFLLLCVVNCHFFFSNDLVIDTEDQTTLPGDDLVDKNKTLDVTTDTSMEKDKVRTPVVYSCDSVSHRWFYFEEYVFVFIDFCFDCLIPFVVMLTCNYFIGVSLRRSDRDRPRTTTKRELTRPGSNQMKSRTEPHLVVSDESSSSVIDSASSVQRNKNKDDNNKTSLNDAYDADFSDRQRGSFLQPLGTSYKQANGCGLNTENSAEQLEVEMDTGVNEESLNPRDELQRNGIIPTSGSTERIFTRRRRVSKSRSKLAQAETESSKTKDPREMPTNRKLSPPSSKNSPQDKKSTLPHSQDTVSRETVPNVTKHTSTSRGVTRMLLLMTMAFMLMTFPSAIYYIIDSFLREKNLPKSRTNEILDLTLTVTNLLQYSNYSCNFFLYTFRSKRFRQELSLMFGLINSRFRRHFQTSMLSGTLQSLRQTSTSRGPTHSLDSHADSHQEQGVPMTTIAGSVLEGTTLTVVQSDTTQEPDPTLDSHNEQNAVKATVTQSKQDTTIVNMIDLHQDHNVTKVNRLDSQTEQHITMDMTLDSPQDATIGTCTIIDSQIEQCATMDRVLDSQTEQYTTMDKVLDSQTEQYTTMDMTLDSPQNATIGTCTIIDSQTEQYPTMDKVLDSQTEQYTTMDMTLDSPQNATIGTRTIIDSQIEQCTTMDRVLDSQTEQYTTMDKVLDSQTEQYKTMDKMLDSHTEQYTTMDKVLDSQTEQYTTMDKVLDSQTEQYKTMDKMLDSHTEQYTTMDATVDSLLNIRQQQCATSGRKLDSHRENSLADPHQMHQKSEDCPVTPASVSGFCSCLSESSMNDRSEHSSVSLVNLCLAEDSYNSDKADHCTDGKAAATRDKTVPLDSQALTSDHADTMDTNISTNSRTISNPESDAAFSEYHHHSCSHSDEENNACASSFPCKTLLNPKEGRDNVFLEKPSCVTSQKVGYQNALFFDDAVTDFTDISSNTITNAKATGNCDHSIKNNSVVGNEYQAVTNFRAKEATKETPKRSQNLRKISLKGVTSAITRTTSGNVPCVNCLTWRQNAQTKEDVTVSPASPRHLCVRF